MDSREPIGWLPHIVANTNHFRTVAVDHTVAATDEMRQIAEEFRTLAVLASIAPPAIDELRSFIPLPDQNETNAWPIIAAVCARPRSDLSRLGGVTMLAFGNGQPL